MTILPPQIEKQESSYSVAIEMNTTCPASNKKPDMGLTFKSTDGEKKSCKVPFPYRITCGDFTYGRIDSYPTENFRMFAFRS